MGCAMAASITGLDDLRAVLAEIPAQMRKKVIMTALRKAARVPLQIARREVPVMSSSEAAKNPYRTAGLLKNRLTVRVSKASRSAGNIGVFINVRPADGAKFKTQKNNILGIKWKSKTQTRQSNRGAKSKLDPYYWKFQEFGTKHMKARPFIQPAAESLPEALEVFMREVIPSIEKWNKRK